MQVDKKAVAKLQNIVDRLSEVAEERIRSSERHKQAMQALKESGYNSIEESEIGLKELDAKISTKENKLESDFEEFMEEFNDNLQED